MDSLPTTTELTSQPQDMHIVDPNHCDEHAGETNKTQARKRVATTSSNDLESGEEQVLGWGGGGIVKGDASLADSLAQVFDGFQSLTFTSYMLAARFLSPESSIRVATAAFLFIMLERVFSPIVAQQILLLVAILFFLFAYAPLDTSRVLGLPPTVRFTTQKHLVPFLAGFFIVSYGKTLPVSFSPPPPSLLPPSLSASLISISAILLRTGIIHRRPACFTTPSRAISFSDVLHETLSQ